MEIIKIKEEDPCPCGSESSYAQCCKPYLTGTDIPKTAQSLMRSRYTAYALGLSDYLQGTWHADTRPESLCFPDTPVIRWLSLKVINTQEGGEHDDSGTVEFVARFRIQSRVEELHEISEFTRHEGKWYYLRALGQNE